MSPSEQPGNISQSNVQLNPLLLSVIHVSPSYMKATACRIRAQVCNAQTIIITCIYEQGWTNALWILYMAIFTPLTAFLGGNWETSAHETCTWSRQGIQTKMNYFKEPNYPHITDQRTFESHFKTKS